MIVAMVAPLGRRSSPRTRACFEFARLVCSPLPAACGTLDEACALVVRPRLRLDMPKTPLNRAGAHGADHPNPAALAGERSKPARLAVRDHHRRSLCGKSPAQRKGAMVLLDWPPPDHLGRKSRQFLPAQASCRDPGTRPELRPTVAERELVSAAGIRLDPSKSVRPFKGIFCDDISEFESHMPSQAVGSLWRVYPVHGLCPWDGRRCRFHENRT